MKDKHTLNLLLDLSKHTYEFYDLNGVMKMEEYRRAHYKGTCGTYSQF